MKPQAVREQAKKMYVEEGLTYAQIAARIGTTEKTVWGWGKPDVENWPSQRDAYIKSKQMLHEELYQLTRKIMQSLREDIEAGREPSQTRTNLFKTLLNSVPKTREYEQAIAKATADESNSKPKGISEETLRKVEEEVFGIRH